MQQIATFIGLVFVLFIVGTLLPKMGFIEPALGIGFTLFGNMVMAGWVYFTITRHWKAMSPEEQGTHMVLNRLRHFFLVSTIFFCVDIIPHTLLPILAPTNEFLITIAHWFAHIFLVLTLILMFQITLDFINPVWKRQAVYVVTILGVVTLLSSAMYHDTIFNIPGMEYPMIRSSVQFATLNLVLQLATFGFGALYLLWRAIGSREHVVRVRSILFAIGMLAGGPLIGYMIHFPGNVPELIRPHAPFIISLLFWIWGAFLGAGALYATAHKDSLPKAQ